MFQGERKQLSFDRILHGLRLWEAILFLLIRLISFPIPRLNYIRGFFYAKKFKDVTFNHVNNDGGNGGGYISPSKS